jgi:hypothetical protein
VAEDKTLSYPGVFRPLLHTVEIGSQQVVIRGVTYYFALCGSACLSRLGAGSSLLFAYLPCPKCEGVSGRDTLAINAA